ncbi:MAG: HAD-IA family hydrolase [Olsenella sp.]|jgi:putative hydrolase of the HAD superfamily
MDCVLFDLDDTLYDQVRPFELGYRETFGDRFDSPAPAGGPVPAAPSGGRPGSPATGDEPVSVAARGPLDVVALFNASRRHSDEAFEAATRGEISMEEMYVWRLRRTFADFDIDVTADECLRMQSAYAAAQRDAIFVPSRMEEVLDWCAAREPRGTGRLAAGRSSASSIAAGSVSASPIAAERSVAAGSPSVAGHPLGIITNGPVAHQMEKVETLGLSRWFAPESIVVSGAVGVAKPDPRIFRIACERLGTRPEDCVYVGDSFASDVVGATSAGMPVVWFNHRHREAPAGPGVPSPDWVVEDEEGLLALLREIA